MELAARSERKVKALYEEQEKYFYTATIDSIEAKRRSQAALTALVSLVLVLGTTGVIGLRRRTRGDVARAYDALIDEVNERRAAEDALRASEGRFRSLVQRASDLTAVTDVSGNLTYVSPAAEQLLGYRPEDLLSTPLLDHVEPDQRSKVAGTIDQLIAEPGVIRTIELRLRTRGGGTRSVEAVCHNLVTDPDVNGVVWNGRDVTDRRMLEDELTHQAHHDQLTGLPNRALLLSRLESALDVATGDDGCVSVVLVDLDGFKNVNDTLGHAAGDELLQRAAERLRGCVLAGDTAARLGGYEFAILVASGAPEHSVAVGRRVVDALRQADQRRRPGDDDRCQRWHRPPRGPGIGPRSPA